jgi:oligopeptide/dipeptide ABC transporter ATP-binding protein
VKAVDGVTFEVRKGETLGLVGESAAARARPGRALIRLRDADRGVVRFDGIDLGSSSPSRCARCAADADHLPGPVRVVGSADDRRLRSSASRSRPTTSRPGAAKKERVADLLRDRRLDPKYVNRYPHEFSGGQRQRIGVARALAVEPEFIVCDEPISALDVSIQAQVLNLLTDLRQQLGLTYLFIAHDLSVVKHISDRVAVMYLGKIVEIGPPDVMYASPGHPYSRALLSAVPVPDPEMERKRKRVILTGDVPSPVNPPEGCRFHTRCWLYEQLGQPEQCRTVDPPLRTLTGDHGAACHFAEQAQASDVGVSHIEMSPIRRGTPEAALKTIRPELAGAQALEHTVDIAETVIGGPPTDGGSSASDGDASGSDGSSGAGEGSEPPRPPLS